MLSTADITLPHAVAAYIRNLEILTDGVTYFIKGTSKSYYIKSMAQESLKHLIPKSSIIRNQIKVERDNDGPNDSDSVS